MDARAAEAAAAALGFVERVNDVPFDILDFLNDELGDSIARRNLESRMSVKINERDLKLATVMAIDEARSVEHGNALLNREAAARLNETRIPFRDRDRKTRGN